MYCISTSRWVDLGYSNETKLVLPLLPGYCESPVHIYFIKLLLNLVTHLINYSVFTHVMQENISTGKSSLILTTRNHRAVVHSNLRSSTTISAYSQLYYSRLTVVEASVIWISQSRPDFDKNFVTDTDPFLCLSNNAGL